ncbi:hypothetical protein [Sphingopyxis panaciterrulae]|uniref:Uncharacterized protein n=1 Tax=Sphingopyxis panaciterrulae TaxID=462372 RepID=A0A7W9B7E7_9SPHN|nr:hypothetical protein [Sphingopyxis panaciterrulae]MBB5707664.1 hypothetical protein [Sphingopyxis panaciterrulae]
MLKERLALAKKVATQVQETEAAIDAAIAKMGELVTLLPEAQAAAKLSPVVSDASFGYLHLAIAGLFDGRANMVALHNELSSVKDKMGLRNVIVGTGDLGKLLPPNGRIAKAGRIAAIAEAQIA